MSGTKVGAYTVGVLIGYLVGYIFMYLIRSSIGDGYDLFAVFCLGFALLGVWILGVHYALGDGRNDG